MCGGLTHKRPHTISNSPTWVVFNYPKLLTKRVTPATLEPHYSVSGDFGQGGSSRINPTIRQTSGVIHHKAITHGSTCSSSLVRNPPQKSSDRRGPRWLRGHWRRRFAHLAGPIPAVEHSPPPSTPFRPAPTRRVVSRLYLVHRG